MSDFYNCIDKGTKSYYNKTYEIVPLGGESLNSYGTEAINKINYLSSEIDALYHQASLKLGISDSVSIILYTVYDAGRSCLLSDIYKKSGISKQTVNSAIRGLEKDKILYLEQHTGRAKKVVLTDKGRNFVNETVGKLHEAEIRAFSTWSEEEISTYIHLMEKYTHCFRKQIENMDGCESPRP